MTQMSLTNSCLDAVEILKNGLLEDAGLYSVGMVDKTLSAMILLKEVDYFCAGVVEWSDEQLCRNALCTVIEIILDKANDRSQIDLLVPQLAAIARQNERVAEAVRILHNNSRSEQGIFDALRNRSPPIWRLYELMGTQS